MRRNMNRICLAAAFGLALLPSAVRAGTAVFHQQGETAYANFANMDAAGCVYTQIDVHAFEDRMQAPPGPPERGSWATLYVYQYDYCQERTLLNADGETVLSPDAFRVFGSLQSARVDAVITLNDFVSGGPLQASLSFTWTGTSELFQGGSSNHVRNAQYSISSRYTGSQRQADATGTILVGSTSIESGASGFAVIQSSETGRIEHVR